MLVLTGGAELLMEMESPAAAAKACGFPSSAMITTMGKIAALREALLGAKAHSQSQAQSGLKPPSFRH